MTEQHKEIHEGEQEIQEEELFFPNSRVVKLIKDDNPKKIVKRQVKVEMNKLLEQIGRNIAKEMSKKPYASINYTDFLDAARPYLEIQRANQERKKVIATLEKIKEDAAFLSGELQEKSKEEEY